MPARWWCWLGLWNVAGCGLIAEGNVNFDDATQTPTATPDTTNAGEPEVATGDDAPTQSDPVNPKQPACPDALLPLGANGSALLSCSTFRIASVETGEVRQALARVDLQEVALMVAGSALEFDASDGSIDRIIAADRSSFRVAGLGFDSSGIWYGVRSQSDGAPPIGIFVLRNLRLDANTSLRIVGSNAVALVVRDEVAIAGSLLGSASNTAPGPGGGLGGGEIADGTGLGGGRGAPASEIVVGYVTAFGGGGGSFGSKGGRGGGSSGGTARSGYSDSTLSPLFGGSGGGGGSNPRGARGGHGGGAVQITAGREIVVSGAIDVSGSGGGNAGNDGAGGGGGGGGSGGSLLLEAPQVSVTGSLAANGGAGGVGGNYSLIGSSPDLSFAASGDPAACPAPAAAGGGSSGGGGNGSNPAGVASPGKSSGDTFARSGGGGGGGSGRILIRTASGTDPFDTSVIQPTIASGLSKVDRLLAP